jgi:hypothetical protein
VNPLEYEVAFYAQTVWQLARSSNQDELLAVACVIRNHVVPRLGQVAAYPSFYEACQDFLAVYPSHRPIPSLSEPAFVAPGGLLFNISAIYDCSYEDVTATHDHPNGAKYFANEPDDWFKAEIAGRPDIHPLIGQYGSMYFYV